MGKRWMCMLLCGVAGALGLSGTAFAADTTIVVNPSTPDWGSFTETPVASGSFTALAGSPSGAGAYRFQTNGGGQLVGGAVFRGTKLPDVTALSFSSYSVSGAGLSTVAPSVQIGWDPDLDDADENWKGRLVGFYNPTPAADQWITWDALAQFGWYFTNALGDPAALGCTLASPCTWAAVTAAYPNGGVSEGFYDPPANTFPIGFIGLKAGSGEGVTDRYADALAVTVAGDKTTYDFEPATACATSTTGTTITLLADCIVDSTFVVPAGHTLDGDGNAITAVDPAGGHFLGAVVKAGTGGGPVHVTDLEVTASGLADVCDPSSPVDTRLRGILFDGVGGSITGVSVHGVRQGLSGCQEGNAIEARNFSVAGQLAVVISGNAVSDYQKNAITANGDVAATITGNTVTGDGNVSYIAQNGIQVGFGATALVTGNSVSGNWYTAPVGQLEYDACGILLYQAAGVRQSKNTLFGNEKNLCNVGRGGGRFSPA